MSGWLPLRKSETRQNSESSVSSSSSCWSDAVNNTDQDKAFNGLPELIDKCWWIKSFFHSEPSPPAVGRKTLSASSYRE
ncbi:PREDICTED: pancreatic progenitor cell differentiation and proliferation factor-like protein [Nipponia nippon]|uniref:pancreatic progenitor cell differentiation and proliferation factor-like protein n=1 Tax=Nipponia nippon TaxID=128390 RepID=UPI0005107FAA|nr:PREDICTED: pancreatic progenitor cell differentiation and proliferation factor-like protein [Nipponia nippon]